jgi:hypothetical protein
VNIVGDVLDTQGKPMVEKLEVWRRDPVAVIQELLGNPLFVNNFMAAPEQAFRDPELQEKIVDDSWTASWWWEIQVRELGIKDKREAYLHVIERD